MFWALSIAIAPTASWPPGGTQSRHERDRPRVSLGECQSCSFEQERGNDAVDDRMICNSGESS